MTKLLPVLLSVLAISAAGPPATTLPVPVPQKAPQQPVVIISPKMAAITGKAVVQPKTNPPPMASLAWDLTNQNPAALAGIQLTSGHASGQPFQTNRLPVTNGVTLAVPGPSRPAVFLTQALGTNGLVSGPSNEAYWRVATNGTVWNDTNGVQHFSFVAGSNQVITVQMSQSPKFTNPAIIYTNLFPVNTMVDIIRPKTQQEYFKLLRQ
jgi:hypothetical protein